MSMGKTFTLICPFLVAIDVVACHTHRLQDRVDRDDGVRPVCQVDEPVAVAVVEVHHTVDGRRPKERGDG